MHTNADDDHEREIEPDMMSDDVTNENTNDQNDLDNIPMFSPPSVSNTLFNSGIPRHFVRLDPRLHAEPNKRVKIESNVRQPQKSADDLEIVQSIFPGEFTYVS